MRGTEGGHDGDHAAVRRADAIVDSAGQQAGEPPSSHRSAVQGEASRGRKRSPDARRSGREDEPRYAGGGDEAGRSEDVALRGAASRYDGFEEVERDAEDGAAEKNPHATPAATLTPPSTAVGTAASWPCPSYARSSAYATSGVATGATNRPNTRPAFTPRTRYAANISVTGDAAGVADGVQRVVDERVLHEQEGGAQCDGEE